jgi:predicted outer membrane protein
MTNTGKNALTAGVFALSLGLGSFFQSASSQQAQQTQTSQMQANVDMLFVATATMSNAFEVESSRLALQRSSDAALKKYAQKMIDEHTKAQEAVAKLPNAQQALASVSGMGMGMGTGATGSTTGTTNGGTTGAGTGTDANGAGTGTTTGTGTTGTDANGTGSTTGGSGAGATTGTGGNGTGTGGNGSSTGSGTGAATGTGTTGTGTTGTGTTGTGTTGTSGTATGSGTTGSGTTGSGTTGSGTNDAQVSSGSSMMSMLGMSGQLKIAALSKLQGAQFDRAYVTEQIAGHEEAIRAFRFAANNAQDQQVKAFAAQTLPTLQGHYAEIAKLAKTVAR